MNSVDKLLAWAQVTLAGIVAFGFLGVLAALLYIAQHPVNLQQTIITMLTGLLATLGTIFTLQMNYFFARHRPQGLPDPTNGNGNGDAHPLDKSGAK
jgi:hypothetical protein